MNAATTAREDAGRPSLDIACGDINMARRNAQIQSSGAPPLITSTRPAASFQFLIGAENVASWAFARRGPNSFLEECGAKHTGAGLSVSDDKPLWLLSTITTTATSAIGFCRFSVDLVCVGLVMG